VSLYGVLVAVILWGASMAGAYFAGEKVGSNGEIATQAREDRVAKLATDAAASAAAGAIAAQRPKNVTIRQETEREIRTNTVYAECRHSPEQLQRLNAALTGDDPLPAGSGLVPKAGPLVGQQLRSDDPKAR